MIPPGGTPYPLGFAALLDTLPLDTLPLWDTLQLSFKYTMLPSYTLPPTPGNPTTPEYASPSFRYTVTRYLPAPEETWGS